MQWAVGRLGGNWRLGWKRTRGFQGQIVPVAPPTKRVPSNPNAAWYTVLAKQKDQASRRDVDLFGIVMFREKCWLGYLVAFNFSSDALSEIRHLQRKHGITIKPLTVWEILTEQPEH